MCSENKMSLHDYYYDLPEELIAQDPLEDRSSSRLMVLDKETGNVEHHVFKEIIDYLNHNLTKELSIDNISDRFFMSRYYLMHSFKEATGYTIGNYVSTKRLLLARDLIQNGTPVKTACYECGFKSYSAFIRAYKKSFDTLPSASFPY